MIQNFIAYFIYSSVLFVISIIPKSGHGEGRAQCFMNYWTVWVIFQGHDLMHMQPHTLRCCDSWLLSCPRINCDPRCCWMSQDHCFDSGTFLKNSWKLEKSYSRCCSSFPYCNTGDCPCKESHKGYGSLVNRRCVLRVIHAPDMHHNTTLYKSTFF